MDDALTFALNALPYAFLFCLGACVGSWLNVCIVRLPLEKSVIWPSSRCGACLRPVRWYDNIPLVSYWRLRGKCRDCGAAFSVRYFFVELLTAVGFVALYHLEIVENVHGLPFIEQHRWAIQNYQPSWEVHGRLALFFAHHAILLSLLIVAAGCDIDGRVIPLSVTVPGMLIGLLGAVLFPWPWPNTVEQAMGHVPAGREWWLLEPKDAPALGLYPWPVWQPSAWFPAGSWRLGLATGLAGIAVGTGLLRVVRFLCERGLGKEALGLGDADLMMMAGAFLGWQPVVAAFFVGAVAALFIAVPQLVLKGDNALPFGPGLAVGLVVTWLSWSWIGPRVMPFFFSDTILLVVGGCGLAAMYIMMAVIGWVQGRKSGP